MDSWALYTTDGNELTRGWQGYEDLARKMAQRRANELGRAVELCRETESDGEIFEPEGD